MYRATMLIAAANSITHTCTDERVNCSAVIAAAVAMTCDAVAYFSPTAHAVYAEAAIAAAAAARPLVCAALVANPFQTETFDARIS